MAGKSYIKVGAYDWDRIKKMYIKTGGQTWTAIRKAYIKTSSGWSKVFDTASNRPFIQGNDIPKIRLNTFRTDSTYNPSGTIDDPVNPVVEAPPVQQMGPSYTSPVLGWPYESLGRHLWGYDGNWVSGNGSSMTFVYTWLYNLTGNPNDNIAETGATSSTGRTDMLTNTASHLGQSDGDYFDRNFLTFRVSATNSAGTASAESTQVYIVRERPTGTVNMVEPDIASPNTTMSATFTYSNSWYNKTDTAESYVEWFAVDNLGDTLTISNRVQIEYLNTFTTTGTTTKAATTFHVPTLTNKYYYARITLNNSNTLPAKFAGSIINVSGFTPNSAFTASANKTAKTATANGPFNLTNAVKTERYVDTGGNFKRYVSVDIGQSSGATQYEVQIEGQYSGVSGTYDTSSSSWYVIQSLDAAAYVYESSRIGGSLIYTKEVLNYKNYRLTARSRNGTSLNGAAYSNNGTSGSYVYVTAPNVAPSAPSISNIQTSSDFFGSYVTFDNYVSSYGSNSWDYFEYSLDNGSNWVQSSSNSGYINTTVGKLYVTAGSTVNLRIRVTNLDGATSSQSNLLSITAFVQPSAPTSVVVKSFSATQGTIFLTAGSSTQSVQGYFEYDSVSTFDYIDGYVNVSSGNAAKIQLSGANSVTRSYTAGVRPFSGQNLTGGYGNISVITTKVLNGSDAMSVSNFTLSSSTTSSLTIAWNGTGAVNKYRARLYQNSNGSLVEDKGYTLTSGSATFTGLSSNTSYYIVVNPRYEYTSNVYEDGTQGTSTAFATPAPNLIAPSIYSVSTSTTGGPVTAYFSGGSGPYYQIYWTVINPLPVQSYTPDGSGSSSPITDNSGPTTTATNYMFVRSVASLNETSVGPSSLASEWSSGYAFNMSTPTYTVTWNNNDGTGTTSSANFTPGGYVVAPSPTRTNYTLNGWYDAPVLDYSYFVSAGNLFYPPSRNITMYARWTYSPPNLTPPSIYYVASGTAGGPVTAYFSGGSGPYYQIWWTTSSTAGTSYDEYGSSSPITDNTGPSSAGTWNMFVRSVSSPTNIGSGPSTSISAWSPAYSFTVSAAPSVPATAPGTPGTPANGWTGGTSYPFSWSAPSAGTVTGGGAATITGYTMKIYEATSASGTGSYQLTTISLGSGTSYTYTSPNASLYYAASVAATNSAGLTGSYSGISAYK